MRETCGTFVLPVMRIYLLLVVVFLFASCRPEKEKEKDIPQGNVPVQLRVGAQVGDEEFQVGQVYRSATDYRFRVETFQLYLSMIELVDAQGHGHLVRDFVLINMDDGLFLEFSVPPGDYAAVQFHQGIPVEYNKNVDPTTYPNSHPLSVQGSNGMFWTWNTGYIFTRFDGKADLDGVEGNPLMDPFAFHTGDDPLLRTISLPLNNVAFKSGVMRSLSVVIQINSILDHPVDPIDIAIDNLTHTGGNFILARRFVDNLSDSYLLVE